MTRIPKVFLSEMFGELRVICEDNKFFFCAIDVCKALGYTNITRELNIHCRQDGIKSGRVEVAGIPRIVRCRQRGISALHHAGYLRGQGSGLLCWTHLSHGT